MRQEREFANSYEGFERVIMSGAAGATNPLLRGDIRGRIGRQKYLLEMKSWFSVDGKGEKTINVPLSVLDKIRREGETEGRYSGVVFHPKHTNRYIAIFDWDDFFELMTEQEEYINRLEEEINAR